MHSLSGLWSLSRPIAGNPSNCVKCGQPHNSQACTKPKDTPATCALCGGSHPASYKGCTVYRDLKARRHPKQIYERTTNTTTKCQITPSPQLARAQSNHPTYAQVTASNMAVNNATMDQFSTFLNEFKNIFSQLLNQNSMILSMLTTVINKLT